MLKTLEALFLALLSALTIAAPASASASWSAADPACGQGGCVVSHAPSPWVLPGGDTYMLIYKGWPVRWMILRHNSQLWVSCWGGRHTRQRPQDLYSILTVRDQRTGQTATVDCRSPQGLNWTHEVPVLGIHRSDPIEVWKTPTRPVP